MRICAWSSEVGSSDLGEAPAALDGLEAPYSVFRGGGFSAGGMIEACWTALKPGGRLVADAVTLESEAALLAWQRDNGGALTRFDIARAKPVGGFQGWGPLMPVTQLSAEIGRASCRERVCQDV